jgi:Ca2+-binding EF-hand superfamily protein
MRERFEDMDANKDGKVTFEEFKSYNAAHLQDRFKRLDRNGDGVLSEADREVAPPAGEPVKNVTTDAVKDAAPQK